MLAAKAWHWMGNGLDWSALPTIAEVLGIDDLELLIVQLITIRDWNR